MKKHLVFMLILLIASLCVVSCNKPNATRVPAQDSPTLGGSSPSTILTGDTTGGSSDGTTLPDADGSSTSDDLFKLEVGSRLELVHVYVGPDSVTLRLKVDNSVEDVVEVKLSASVNGDNIKMSEGTIFAKMDGKDVRVYVYRLLWSTAVSYYHFGFTVGTPEKENDVLHSKSAITFRGDNHPMGHKFSLCEYHQYNSDNELFNVKLLIEILEPQEKRVKNEDANGYRYYYIRYKAALTAFLEI